MARPCAVCKNEITPLSSYLLLMIYAFLGKQVLFTKCCCEHTKDEIIDEFLRMYSLVNSQCSGMFNFNWINSNNGDAERVRFSLNERWCNGVKYEVFHMQNRNGWVHKGTSDSV